MRKNKNNNDNENECKDWLNKIDRAIKVKEEWLNSFRIALAYEYLEGRQRPPWIPEQEWITVNLVYSNLRAILPTLYRTDPYFYVKLKRSFQPNPLTIAMYEQRGRIRQSMLNYLKIELAMKEKVRLSIFDAMFQYGVIKTHYKADLVENPDKGNYIKDDNGEYIFDEYGELMNEPELLPARDSYVITRVHPNDFVVDEDAGPLQDDWSWVAQRIKRPAKEEKNDKSYTKESRENVKASEILREIDKSANQRKKGGVVYADKNKKEPEIVVEWEIYDLKNEQWMVVAEGNNDFLLNPQALPLGIEKHPFSILKFFERDNSFYPIPQVTQWIDPQREYCDLRSKILVHRKRFNRKYVVMGEVDPNEISKLENGEDGTVIQVAAGMMGSPVQPITDAPLDANHWQEIIALRKDFDDVAVGPNQRGVGAGGVDSATEAGIIEKRVMIQEGDDIAKVTDFTASIARKLDQIVQANITKDQAIKVTGADGNDQWELVKQTDYDAIEGEYDYGVNIGDTLPQLPEIERSQWITFLTTIANAPQLALSKRLIQKTAEMHHIYDESMVDEIFQIAQKMMSGAIPRPGQQGSAPGSPAMPESTIGGGAGMDNINRGGA